MDINDGWNTYSSYQSNMPHGDTGRESMCITLSTTDGTSVIIHVPRFDPPEGISHDLEKYILTVVAETVKQLMEGTTQIIENKNMYNASRIAILERNVEQLCKLLNDKVSLSKLHLNPLSGIEQGEFTNES